MIFKQFESRILIRVLLLLVTLTAISFCLVKGEYLYAILIAPIAIYLIYNFYQVQLQVYKEVAQFVEAIHYRDFTQQYNEKKGSSDIKELRKGFNEINKTFKIISREKETQYYYLQKILELVDTGILSYQEESGEVVWMNESLKKILEVSYLKSLEGLSRRYNDLSTQVKSLKTGGSKIVAISVGFNTLKLLLSASAFQTEGKKYKLIAFKNINEALDQTESQAWQKLLSVLTHEIMNSIAPISSLADTLKNLLESAESSENLPLEDLKLGIGTIKSRSEGLLKFAKVYRSLNTISKPDLKKLYIRDVFENLHHLMQPTLEQKNIELEIILKDPNLVLEADPILLEQVLINLIVNAIDAVKDSHAPRIALSSLYSDGKPVIKVSDNGKGISREVIEQIFVPFFSTKKGGSGIGLTLCKQIMLMHHGSIQVHSKVNEGTVFVLNLGA